MLTSIVIPCAGGLAFTRDCVASIEAWTPEEHEIVLVDNGSDDGTAEWFAERGAGVLVRSSVRLGFAGAVNLGIAAASGDVVVLLNNDTLVCERWLGAMLDAIARDPEIGLVGVRSNAIIAEQALTGVPEPGPALDEFVAERARDLAGRGHRVARLSGMCMAIHRPVIERIGAFDPQFHPGYFEDDDYSLRARRAGFGLWLAEDSFVYHFGSQTIMSGAGNRSAGVSYGTQLLHANHARFRAKWGLARYEDPLADTAALVGHSAPGDFIPLPAL